MLGILLITLAVLLMINMPVAFAVLSASSLYLILSGAAPLTIMIQRMFTGVDLFVFLAIPFFVLAGLIMQKGGLAERLITFASLLLDRMTGGFAMATSLASLIFASISGSGPATTAAIGGSMLPELERKGYGKEWSVAYIASSGTMGPIIPPSITLVLFGALAGTSISALFIGGIMPGILIGISLMIMAFLRAKKMGIESTKVKVTNKQLLSAFADALLAIMMPIIIIGGILFGVFTPTEAAVISVVYALFVCTVIYRSLDLKTLFTIFTETASISAVIMILTANASVFAWILSVERAPQQLIAVINSVTENKLLILLLINVMLILIGCFLDTTSALIITVPTMLVLGAAIDIEPLHMGLIMSTNLAIGMATPPLGFTLFTACSIGNVSITKTIRPILPMIGIMVLVVLLVTYFPQVFLWLPNLLVN